MQIVFNITEDSNVKLEKGEYELVQGECCVTELKFNFPETIKGVAIGNYKKRIEFGECKDLGECVKFIDDINGDTYELKKNATAFKKIMVQVVLSYGDIVWKTVPVALEFHESVNAEGNTVIQAQILSLAQIEREWENYIKANTFRVISNVADMPTADASSLGKTIFYLGANTDTAPLLTYGHYYRCNYVEGVYVWTDLTRDPSLEDVANGVREINKNQTLQFWTGTSEEYNALTEAEKKNLFAVITDDKTAEKFDEAISQLESIVNGETVVPKAADIEHLYLHSITFIIECTNSVDAIENIIFSVTYADPSGEAIDKMWYINNWIYKRAAEGVATFCTRIYYSFSLSVTEYAKIEFKKVDNEFKAYIYDKDGNAKECLMYTINAEVGTPLQIR